MMTKQFQFRNVKSVKSKSFFKHSFMLFIKSFVTCLLYRREANGDSAPKGKGKKKGVKQRSGGKKPKAGGGERNPKKKFGGRKRR